MLQFEELSPDYLAEDNSNALLYTCITLLIIDTLVISLLYISRWLGKDYRTKLSIGMTVLLTAGYCVSVGKIVLGILIVRIGGAGRHLASLDRPTQINTLKLQLGLQIVCPLTTSFSKLGILFLFQELFGHTSKTYRNVIRFTFVLVCIIIIVQLVIPLANCKPFNFNWNLGLPNGSCAISSFNLWRYLSVPNVATTVIMIMIPLPILFNLKVGLAKKLAYGFIFMVALVGLIAAIMRFVSFMRVASLHDITYDCITPLCWTVAESGIYLLAGVLPTLKPLFKAVFGHSEFERLLSGSRSKTSRSWPVRTGSDTPHKDSLPMVQVFDRTGNSEKTCREADVESAKSRDEFREIGQ